MLKNMLYKRWTSRTCT